MRKLAYVKPGLKPAARPPRGTPSTIPCPRCHRALKWPEKAARPPKHQNQAGKWCSGRIRRHTPRTISVLPPVLIRVRGRLVPFDVKDTGHLDRLRRYLSMHGLREIVKYAEGFADTQAARRLYADERRERKASEKTLRERVMEGSKLATRTIPVEKAKIDFGGTGRLNIV